MVRIGKQLGQGGAGPGGNKVEGLGRRVFHSLVPNFYLQVHGFRRGDQEDAFLGGGFVQSYGNPVPQQFRQNQAGKPGA